MIILKTKNMKWWILALIIGAVVGLLDRTGGDSPNPQDTELLEDEERNSKGELILVYIGSSQCSFSNLDSVSIFVSAIIDRTESQATEKEYDFWSIGIAVDTDLNKGIDHLNNTAEFDQISVGAGWDNHSLRRYVTELARGPMATPQIVLVERLGAKIMIDGVELDEESQRERGTERDSVVYRAVGVTPIRKWAKTGSVSDLKHNRSNWVDGWYPRLEFHIIEPPGD